MKVQMNKRIGRLIFYFLIVVFAIIIVFPFLWQILTSFKPLSEISSMPPKWLPSELNLEYYVNVLPIVISITQGFTSIPKAKS